MIAKAGPKYWAKLFLNLHSCSMHTGLDDSNRNSQTIGYIRVTQMLAVDEQQNLAIHFRQAHHCVADGIPQLFAFQRLVRQIVPICKLSGRRIGLNVFLHLVNRFVQLSPKLAAVHTSFIDNNLQYPRSEATSILKF